MADPPPSIPYSVVMTVRTGPPKLTVADLERALEREQRNLEARVQERQRLVDQVSGLDRQIANVRRSIEEIEERIQGATALERMQYLEEEVERLKRELREARDTRDGREFG